MVFPSGGHCVASLLAVTGAARVALNAFELWAAGRLSAAGFVAGMELFVVFVAVLFATLFGFGFAGARFRFFVSGAPVAFTGSFVGATGGRMGVAPVSAP